MRPKLWIYLIKRPYHWLKTGLFQALPASFKYRHPFRQLKVIAVTGTDGKSTTASLIHQFLLTADISSGLLTTVAAQVGKQSLETGLHVTSPQPKFLQEFARRCLDAGCEYLVLELTSHGFYQYRAWGIKPTLAVLTNLTHEHLDYHHDLPHYAQAKAGILNSARKAIVANNAQGLELVQPYLNEKSVEYFSPQQWGSNLIKEAIKNRFQETYNQNNAQLAARVALELGISPRIIAQAVKNFQNLPGRMEFVPSQEKFKLVIDFAHTPNALENALKSLRSLVKSPGRLIAIYGSAGKRDYTKRPLMGEAGTKNADLVILTAEDPRTENVWSIIRQMKEQLEINQRKIISIADRAQAITYAVSRAQTGDVIGIFGKGHEQSMCYGDRELPWSDRQVAEQALQAKQKIN